MSNASTKVTDLDNPLAFTGIPTETRYVDIGGSDAPGTTGDDDSPYATIAAVNASITDASAEKTYLVHLSPGFFVYEFKSPWIRYKGSGQEVTVLVGPDEGDIEVAYTGLESFTHTIQDCYVDSMIITRDAGNNEPDDSIFSIFELINCGYGSLSMTGSGSTGADPFIFDFLKLNNCIGGSIEGNAINLAMNGTTTTNITLTGTGVDDELADDALIQNWFNCASNFINLTGLLAAQPRNTKVTRVTLNGTSCSYNADVTSWVSGSATNNTQLLSSATMAQLTKGSLSTRMRNPVATKVTSPYTLNAFVDQTIMFNLTVPGAVTCNLPTTLTAGQFADGMEWTIGDATGDASTNTITINAPSGFTFFGGGSTDTITSDGGSKTYQVVGTIIRLKSKNY